ncbi:MAG TPA: hypothetical protein VK498_00795 [Ferruginibacter sp.]|nr:hypothetical protein [Ferruginibacter sp.]
MTHLKKITAALLIILLIHFSACNKSEQYISSATIQDYSPLAVGKYISYNLDSIVTVNFGSGFVIRNYQVKYQVDELITDNLGRPAYRIIRYIRKTVSNPWQPDATFMAVNTGTSLEFVENNLRFIKLKFPVRNGYAWKGNSFIDTQSGNSELIYLDNWDYEYDSVGVRTTIGTFNLERTLIVKQQDELIGDPADPLQYSEKNYAVEKYAEGIGMVYHNFFHSEFQPARNGMAAHFKDGSYGIILTMIDHN